MIFLRIRHELGWALHCFGKWLRGWMEDALKDAGVDLDPHDW